MQNTYVKYDINESIEIGDLVSLKDDKVIRSYQNYNKKPDIKIIGVCKDVRNDLVLVQQSGICIINIVGAYGISSMVTASEIPGKGRALKYEQEKRMFNLRSVGKVIEIYNDEHKAKILLDLE